MGPHTTGYHPVSRSERRLSHRTSPVLDPGRGHDAEARPPNGVLTDDQGACANVGQGYVLKASAY
jgi:hypothetical protein